MFNLLWKPILWNTVKIFVFHYSKLLTAEIINYVPEDTQGHTTVMHIYAQQGVNTKIDWEEKNRITSNLHNDLTDDWEFNASKIIKTFWLLPLSQCWDYESLLYLPRGTFSKLGNDYIMFYIKIPGHSANTTSLQHALYVERVNTVHSSYSHSNF